MTSVSHTSGEAPSGHFFVTLSIGAHPRYPGPAHLEFKSSFHPRKVDLYPTSGERLSVLMRALQNWPQLSNWTPLLPARGWNEALTPVSMPACHHRFTEAAGRERGLVRPS